MKQALLAAIFLCSFCNTLFAQHSDKHIFNGCATDLLHNRHPELKDIQSKNDQAAYKAAVKGATAEQGVRNLPVVVHIIHNGGPENISDTQVQQGIDQLNAAFSLAFGTGVNTDIQFCLAQRDPNGQTTTGITRNQSSLTEVALETQDIALKNLNRWSPTCFINIWVVSEIYSLSSGYGVAGYAFFPSAHGQNIDGIVVEADFFGSDQRSTSVLVHEMGHYLGLYHTFEGGCANNDCLQDGDHVCDTPPDQTTFSSCNPNANSCGTDADDLSANNPFTSDVADLGEDYMDYSSLDCYSRFTQGQSDRMNWHITNVRKSLLACLSCQTPCPAPLSASISNPSANQTILIGSTLNFSATATNTVNYSWNVDADPTFATTLNTSYTFNTTGVHWVKFRAVSDDPLRCMDVIDSVKVTVNCDAQSVFSVPPLIQNGTQVTFANSSTNATTFEWLLDNTLVSTSTDLTYTFVNTGVYQLCLRAINAACANTLCATVYVQQNANAAPGCDNTFVQSLAGMGGSRPNIFPHPNGDFFATGLRNDSIVIIRFNQGGAALWARAFKFGNESTQINHLYVDASGDLIGVASPEPLSLNALSTTAFRYNPTSNSFVWIQRFPANYYTQIHALDINNCVMTGESGNANTRLTRISKHNGSISGYDLEAEEGDFYSSIHNGAIYGTSRRYYSGAGDFRASVFAHDLTSGAFQWQNSIISRGNTSGATDTRMYPEKPVIDQNNLLVIASGDLEGFQTYATGAVELVLAKTTLTGDVLWTKEYAVAGYDRPLATAVVNTAGGYYILCNLYQPAIGNFAFACLIKTDQNGNVQWAKRLGISGKNIARNVMERNGYLYITMSSDSYAPNDLLLVKLDQEGNTGTNCGFVQPVSVQVNDLTNVQDQRNYTVAGLASNNNTLAATPAIVLPKTNIYCNTACLCPDLPISSGADTSICAGQSVNLQATVGFDEYEWSPATGLSNPAIENPVATPSVSTLYIVDAVKYGVELILNGDFSQGNTGFTSEYLSAPFGYGTYTVTNDPLQLNSQWIIPLDHSPTADNLMMMMDGDVTGNFSTIWEQSVLVEPNTDYVLDFWSAMAYFASPPIIRIQVNGVTIDTFKLLGGNTVVGIWQHYSGIIKSNNATQLTLTLADLNTEALGNDFALDDISLRSVCHYTDSVLVRVRSSNEQVLDLGPDVSACNNAVRTFDAGAGYAEYRWQDGSTNQMFTAYSAGTYWVTVRDSCGGIQSDTVRVILAPTPELDLGAGFSICAGDSIELSYTFIDFVSYNWSPAGSLSCTTCASPRAKPLVTTTYYLAASTADGCTNLDSLTISVEQPALFTQNISICGGASFSYNGHVYTESGTYLDTLVSVIGCDSIVTTNLSLAPGNTHTENITFCSGDTVFIAGNPYFQPGTVLDTLASTTGGCDTVVTYILQLQSATPSVVSINCPHNISIATLPGTGALEVDYALPVAASDCPCPGIELTLTEGLPSGASFPPGLTKVCYTANDSCGNSAACCFEVYIREEQACDVKEIGCMKYELLTISADAAKNYTYRIRVTNKCANKLIYTAIQLPDGVIAMKPAELSVFQSETGGEYEVRNPNYSPFYSIRFKALQDGISGGESEIFKYTLPAQAVPIYIHLTTRLSIQEFYEAHLNTFYCPIGVTPEDEDKATERSISNLNEQQLRLFPNPSAGELFVDLSDWNGQQLRISVLDIYGRQVRVSTLIADTPLYNLPLAAELANGMYMLELETDKGVKQTERFILQR